MSLLKRIDTRPTTADEAQPAPVMEAPSPIPLMTQLPVRDPYKDEKFKLLQQVMNELDPDLDLANEPEVRRSIEATFKRILEEEGLPLTRSERARLLEQIVDEIIGYGPIEPMLRDDTVTEVMVNGPHSVYIERAGKLEMTNVAFRDDEHVMRIIDRIISPLGRRLDESSPMVDARLPDGSRINAVIPPISLVGPDADRPQVRAPPVHARRPDPLRYGDGRHVRLLPSLRRGAPEHLRLGRYRRRQDHHAQHPVAFIRDDERIVTIEDAAELQLRQHHVVQMEARPSNIEGRGAVTIRDLVRNALRMRPDRIIVGEVPQRRSARHAPGNEHRSRRIDAQPATPTARVTCSPAWKPWYSWLAWTCPCGRYANR